MNPTLFEIVVGTLMLVVGIGLIVWFARYTASASGRRMMRMLTRAGVDPEVARRGDMEAIMHDLRSRCRRCHAEDLCDRWFAGKVEGDNSFCPNAQVFRSLTKAGGRIASSGRA